jgi:geranylgeranyl diphosphate synthase, type I
MQPPQPHALRPVAPTPSPAPAPAHPEHALLRKEDGLAAVEALMTALAVGGRLERAGAMVQEHLGAGGKRLRARLALAAVEALGLPRREGVGWAAAVELLHNASLVHDDIQDGDRLRRGRPTLWARHGVGQAINAGDLLLMLPYLAVEHATADPALRWQLVRLLATLAADTARGQSEEMGLLAAGRLDQGSYLRAVEGKTGALIRLPVEGAALLAGRGTQAASALGLAFAPLGVLFQLQDDLLDLYGDKARGAPGNDLREGKVSALVVAHLERAPEDRDALLALLSTPRAETDEAAVQATIRSFLLSGAARAVQQEVHALATQVQTDPVLRAEPALHAVASDLVHLALAPIRHLEGAL